MVPLPSRAKDKTRSLLIDAQEHEDMVVKGPISAIAPLLLNGSTVEDSAKDYPADYLRDLAAAALQGNGHLIVHESQGIPSDMRIDISEAGHQAITFR